MLIGCLSIIGQPSKTVSMKGQPKSTSTQVVNNQQETILKLQAENKEMQKQLEKMEKDIEFYRGDVRAKEAAINENQSHWLTMLSIVIGSIVSILGIGLGIIAPMVLNARNDKRIKDSFEKMLGEMKTQIESVEKEAKTAKESLSAITGLKEDIDNIKKDIDKSKKAAERAARGAIANKLFTQAISEKDLFKSIELYTKAINLNPYFSEAYNNRGYAKQLINDKEGALEDYNKSIELDPNLAEAYNNRGNVKDDLNDKEGAMKDFDKAIELNPQYANAYNNRGTLKNDLGDENGAMKDLNKAIELAPNLIEAYCNRGNLRRSIGDIDGAMEDLNKANDLNPLFYGIYSSRGLLKKHIGNIEGAIKDFCMALSLNSKDKVSYESRAICYRKLADKEKNSAKKAELIAKAEVDEQKAESLKKESKG